MIENFNWKKYVPYTYSIKHIEKKITLQYCIVFVSLAPFSQFVDIADV